jgi:hypothetical protein
MSQYKHYSFQPSYIVCHLTLLKIIYQMYPGTANIQSDKPFLANNKWKGKLNVKFILAIHASINIYSF